MGEHQAPPRLTGKTFSPFAQIFCNEWKILRMERVERGCSQTARRTTATFPERLQSSAAAASFRLLSHLDGRTNRCGAVRLGRDYSACRLRRAELRTASVSFHPNSRALTVRSIVFPRMDKVPGEQQRSPFCNRVAIVDGVEARGVEPLS
jgi:hypothetical protein